MKEKLTRYKGVYLNKAAVGRPYYSHIDICGKLHHLGSFETQEDAAVAWDNAAYYLHKAGLINERRLIFPEDYFDDPEKPREMLPATAILINHVRMRTGNTDADSEASLLRRLRELILQVETCTAEQKQIHKRLATLKLHVEDGEAPEAEATE